ncbi:MAG: ABC transporter permease [Thermanaerothrix sp.]|nr:ABC transporter permease [Thermanaerothrix sp.]
MHIEPYRGRVPLNIREFWHYRELLYFLVWRDIKVRYKQTLLGAAWAIIQPFFTMVVFSFFFGRMAQMASNGYPYPIFSYTALLPWTYFSGALSLAANSLVGSGGLITKVYFPRLIVPVSSVLSGLVDFAFAFLVLIGMMIYYGYAPTLYTVLLPLFLLLALITALGVGLWLAALNVKYRDVRYLIPFLTQFWLFATPVVYPSSLLSEPWRTLYGLNPMVGVVEGFRWALLGDKPPELMILVSAVVSVVLLVSGLIYFRRTEDTFADLI